MKIFTVDSFTDIPFAGNPAGVCLLDQDIPDDLKQKIATEINYAETAFVLKADEQNTFQLRWFTPTQEVDICGHATLAAAKIIYHTNIVQANQQVHFLTRSGTLTCNLNDERIVMNFPAYAVHEEKSKQLAEAFATYHPKYIGTNNNWCLIEFENEQAVRKYTPDNNILLALPQKIFIATAKSSSPEYDFVSRCFGPAVGIPEDPVTGSAHCYLATYWKEKLNKTKLVGFQASHRTGIVHCEWLPTNQVLLSGNCIIMHELIPRWKN